MKSKMKSFVGSMKSLVGGVLVAGLFIGGIANVGATSIHKDVNTSNTHYKNILTAAELGFMSGYGDGTFKPFRELTRSDVIKTLGKYVLKEKGQTLDTYDMSGVSEFSDVPSDHADQELYKYSLIVKKEGIFTGNNNRLMPLDLISRQQMAQVLVNAFDLERASGVEPKVGSAKNVESQFREAVQILSTNGVTTVSDFRPTESTLRGQFATFLVNAYDVKLNGPIELPVEKEPEKPGKGEGKDEGNDSKYGYVGVVGEPKNGDVFVTERGPNIERNIFEGVEKTEEYKKLKKHYAKYGMEIVRASGPEGEEMTDGVASVYMVYGNGWGHQLANDLKMAGFDNDPKSIEAALGALNIMGVKAEKKGFDRIFEDSDNYPTSDYKGLRYSIVGKYNVKW